MPINLAKLKAKSKIYTRVLQPTGKQQQQQLNAPRNSLLNMNLNDAVTFSFMIMQTSVTPPPPTTYTGLPTLFPLAQTPLINRTQNRGKQSQLISFL